jgi:UDP-2,4-diacetamido-2,4,6-trideoxy-beta-L-altropyranose hydrolase
MKIVIRVDSSQAIGSGHLVRCRTLAETLRERGADVRFICRQQAGNLIHWLSQAAFPVTVLPAPENSGSLAEDYAAWLGVPPAIDAEQTIAALAGDRPDWLIVDHYGIDVAWEQQLRPHVERIFIIDDLANRVHDCDALLDQNANTEGEQRYRDLVPSSCRLLVGSRYALLRPEYRAYRETLPPRTGEVKRVLVFFGSTDPSNMTGMALAALSGSELQGLEVEVVIGATNPHCAELEQQAAARSKTRLHYSRPHLADLMARADLAIGSGGTVTWERCCLGLPALVVSVAENQVTACRALDESGSIVYLGSSKEIRVKTLQEQINRSLEAPENLLKISTNASLQVDGLGCLRISEFLKPTSSNDLKLRLAQADDAALYFDWVNDPDVRQNSRHSSSIAWDAHRVWFQRKLANSSCYLGLLEAEGLPVGQIRFDLEGEEAVIDYSLDQLVRGRGWATHLVRLGMKLLTNAQPMYLRADVKTQNAASRAVFLRLGFREKSPPLHLQGFQAIEVFRLPFSPTSTVG